ncbi:MAG: thiol reductase thioredoxin, partial [Deltaproteobacteria bacterium]|nr:thiol reductase thioredoxin [Deltaproteobacteria bacterium]
KRFGPVFEAASDKHQDVVFAKVDTEAQPALAGAFGIRSIPTLMVFRDSVLIFQQAGSLPAAALEELVDKVKALDMDKVRAEIAEHEKKQAAAG